MGHDDIPKESNIELHRPALETLRTLIKTSTSSMTSVPKPLKFLRPHYPELQTLNDSWLTSENKVSAIFTDACLVEYTLILDFNLRASSAIYYPFLQ